MIKNREGLILIAGITVSVFFAAPSNCTALPVDLGMAGPGHWSVLEIGPGTVTTQSQSVSAKKQKKHGASSTAQGGVSGNVGIGQNGRLTTGGSQFDGDLYLGDNASAQFSGTYMNNRPVSGKVHLGKGASVSSSYSFTSVSDGPQPMLDQARIDAAAASVAAGKLAPTSSLNQISLKKKTLTLDAGVYNLTSLQLKRSTLTLSGSGSFVFNISSSFALKSARVLLAAGATEANVLFNYTGTSDVSLSGRRGGSVLHGILLALNSRVNLSPGLVVGEIISGSNISIGPGTIIQNITPSVVTVPEGTSTFILSLIALSGLALFRWFATHRPNRRTEPSR
jgi:ice-binding like protein/putative adhesin